MHPSTQSIKEKLLVGGHLCNNG